MAEEQEGSFKVTDRRLFNPDGSLRDPAPDEAAETSPVTAGSAPAPMPAPTASPSDPFAGVDQGEQDQMDLEDLGAGAEEMTEFMAVLMEFAAPAFIHLGLAEHPATGRPQVNLPAAKQSIDMMRVLREKTKGNLSRDEDRFFEGLLSDLQMQFVSLRNSGPGR